MAGGAMRMSFAVQPAAAAMPRVRVHFSDCRDKQWIFRMMSAEDFGNFHPLLARKKHTSCFV
jgi:hypothetical protein